MKEFFINLVVAVGSIFGGGEEEEVKKEEPQLIEEVSKESAPVITESEPKEAPEEELGTVSDGKFEYPQPVEGWAPVLGNDTISENVQEGQEGQVSTVWGNGTQGQGELSMDHPRNLQVDEQGNIYFVDGSQKTAKLRVFDGKQNTTVVDLVNNKLTDKDGFFLVSGLAVIHRNVYISSELDVFVVNGNRINQLDLKISKWLSDNRYENIYRMEGHGDYLYMMVQSKSYYYSFIRYNIETREIEEVLSENTYPAPYNFYVYGDNDIFISTENGYVVWEKLFPRETLKGVDTGFRTQAILDVWIGEDEAMYYASTEDQVYSRIYKNPKGNGLDDLSIVAGGRRGFIDGIKDEVEMDNAVDFVWDGTGYLFADMGNHSIRKLWTDVAPGMK